MAAPSRLDPRRVIVSQDGLDPFIHAPARLRLTVTLAVGRAISVPERPGTRGHQRSPTGSPPGALPG
jgi:hypothetical protein